MWILDENSYFKSQDIFLSIRIRYIEIRQAILWTGKLEIK